MRSRPRGQPCLALNIFGNGRHGGRLASEQARSDFPHEGTLRKGLEQDSSFALGVENRFVKRPPELRELAILRAFGNQTQYTRGRHRVGSVARRCAHRSCNLRGRTRMIADGIDNRADTLKSRLRYGTDDGQRLDPSSQMERYATDQLTQQARGGSFAHGTSGTAAFI